MFGSITDYVLRNDRDSRNSSNESCGPFDAVRSGDPSQLEQLLAVYRPVLWQLAENLVPDALRARLDASDLVQDTLYRGATQFDQFQGTTEAEFSAWLKQILQNLVIDSVRHHSSGKRDFRKEVMPGDSLPGHDQSPSQAIRDKEELDRVYAALQLLDDDQRLAIELRSQGLGFQEIGKRLNRTPDSARMLWGRAIAQLLKMLGHHE